MTRMTTKVPTPIYMTSVSHNPDQPPRSRQSPIVWRRSPRWAIESNGVALCQHCRMPPLFVLTVFKETGPQDFGGFELAEAQETAASDAVGVGEKWAIVKAPGQVGAGEILEEGQGPRR
jgi:hypothetical protein